MSPDEAFGLSLIKLTMILVREQNFLFDFFSLSKVKNIPVASTISSSFPIIDDEDINEDTIQLWQSQLSQPRQVFKDQKAEKRTQELLDGLFTNVKEQLQSVVDTGLKHDQSYSIGMMVQIENHQRDLGKTCHTYIINLLEVLLRKITFTFDKFIVEQVKNIEESRGVAKKKSGILPFIRTFPNFVDRMEKMLSSWDGNSRKSIDLAYQKIVKAIFESLEAEAQQFLTDSKTTNDEKDYLNMHIISIENMHHFYMEVRSRKIPSLEAAVKQAKTLYEFNLDAYCKFVIRKPLGKLLDFFEGVEGLLKTGPADEVSYHVRFSKNSVKEIIKKYPLKEVNLN
jgi:hypothetical protein